MINDETLFKNRQRDGRLRRRLKQRRNLDVEVEVAGVEDESSQAWKDQPMSGSDATRYRAIVARCNFLSIDRPDLMFASKECSRHMSNPTNGAWAAIKRVGRYLISRPRLVHAFRWQSQPTTPPGPGVSAHGNRHQARALCTVRT